MPKKPDGQNLTDRPWWSLENSPGFSGLKSGIKLMLPFVISAVVAYRLLEIGMDLGAESAVAFGSRPQT
jgi:hypothetical protein